MSIIRELVGKPDIRDLKLLSIQVGKTAGVSGKVHDETVGIEKLLLIAAVLLHIITKGHPINISDIFGGIFL